MTTNTVSGARLMTSLTIWCDGGARNNQNADIRQAYGSWAAVRDGQKTETTFNGTKQWQHGFTYGNESGNAAELMTCIKALEYLCDLQDRGWNSGFRLCLDSQLAINALKGVKKPCDQLLTYYKRVTELVSKIAWQLEVVKVGEAQVKMLLGH